MTDKIYRYDLERGEGEPLRLFFMAVVPHAQTPILIPYDVHAILAYTMEEALATCHRSYPQGTMLSITQKGHTPVKQLLDRVRLPEPKPAAPIESPAILKPEKTTKEQFVYGMMLVADDYVKGARDRATLKRIVNKILDHDGKKTEV